MSTLSVDVAVERRPLHGEPFRIEAAFDARDGITVVCGASGAGKSTLLLALVGALSGVRGRIALGDRTWFDSTRGIDLAVRERSVGMLLQQAPLFPHLDVTRNVAFGMRSRGDAGALLDRVGAGDLGRRRPHELSGGQTQRVALARALGSRPAALLLDEPFSALDGASRETLGDLLIELQRENGIPFVHVTHDLSQALRLGTELVLLDRGRVVQTGPPGEVLARPASLAAARAVGTENLFAGTVLAHRPDLGCSEIDIGGTRIQTSLLELAPGSRLTLGLRAEDILLSLRPTHETSARNVLAGIIEEIVDRGPVVELRVNTPAPFRVLITPASLHNLNLRRNLRVHLLIKATAFHSL